MICGALMVFLAGTLLVSISLGETTQPVYLHAASVFVATAAADGSVDILELAGCNRVLRLAEMTGQSLARQDVLCGGERGLPKVAGAPSRVPHRSNCHADPRLPAVVGRNLQNQA